MADVLDSSATATTTVTSTVEFESSIMVQAMGAALVFAIVSETISWFVIYRHDEYKKCIEEIADCQEKVEAMREKMEHSYGNANQ